MKKALFLAGDYWHSAESVRPLADIMLPKEEWLTAFTTDPGQLYAHPDASLIVSFKDPVENNQVPTLPWCGTEWTETLLKAVESGTGFMAVHAALADLKEPHPMIENLTHTVFLMHPRPCEVRVHVLAEHPVTEGVKSFTLPEPDEHYHMRMTAEEGVQILADTVSEHGTQPGLWVSRYGKGRVCCFTPGHTTEILTCDGYVRIMKNAAAWCTAV